MAEVKWQARRVSDSVLVDVTADVDGVAIIAPTPNALEQGGEGAGGVTVDNQDDPPAAVTTLIAPGATISGDEATFHTVQVFASEEDPGAVGAGNLWLRHDDGLDLDFLFVRNQANTAWETPKVGVYGDDGLNPTPTAYIDTTNQQIKITTLELDGSERAELTVGQNISGEIGAGDASFQISTTIIELFQADFGLTLSASGVTIIGSLPSADPVSPGVLWSDSGTLKVSAG